jgi:hypothetical protein
MRRLWTAFQAFFTAIFDGAKAEQFQRVLQGQPLPALPAPEAKTEKRPEPKPAAPKRAAPVRSEAITLLAALQREARFVDFIRESLAGYSDAQIGAAVRDIHRDCGKVLDRLFNLVPLTDREEGAELEVSAGFDPGRCHLTGNVVGEPPFHGRVVHHGWEATQCELPAWTGQDSSLRVVAPIEIEMK